MRKIQYGIGFLAALCMIVVVLITAFQLGICGDESFYEKEYRKYRVSKDLDMEMEDIVDVSRKMMDYLTGKRETLSVLTKIGGEEKDFFNEQDRLHMADVKALFLGGLDLRLWCLGLMVVLLGVLIFMKAKLREILPRVWEAAVLATGLLAAFIGIAAANNFTRVFTKFHEIFFTNDLWMLDYANDYMIRMLPEGFFADMTLRIALIFGGMMLLITAIGIWQQVALRRARKKID